MTIKNISSVSLIGKISSYYNDEICSSPVDIQELLAGETSFIEEAVFEDLYLKTLEFDIVVHDDYDNFKKAGVLIGRVFDIERCEENDISPLEVFDSVDQYTYEIYDMGQTYHEGILSENIFSVESFIIYPEYRNKNVGTAVIHILSDVIEAQFNVNLGCLILEPQPRYDAEREENPEKEQYEFNQEKCERFWDKLGFKRLNDSPYWYFNLDMRMLVDGQKLVKEDEITDAKLVAESATIYEFKPRSKEKEE